jgi:hypothetical protein
MIFFEKENENIQDISMPAFINQKKSTKFAMRLPVWPRMIRVNIVILMQETTEKILYFDLEETEPLEGKRSVSLFQSGTPEIQIFLIYCVKANALYIEIRLTEQGRTRVSVSSRSRDSKYRDSQSRLGLVAFKTKSLVMASSWTIFQPRQVSVSSHFK